jgi:hypothetical protein
VTSFVYFIEGDGLVKIGTTGNIAQRLSNLQTGSPVGLRVLGYYPGDANDEWRLHHRFRHLHSHGEWFRQDEELLEEIERGTSYMCERAVESLQDSLPVAPVNPLEAVLNQFDNLRTITPDGR